MRYIRTCQRCGEMKEVYGKRFKICDDCKKPLRPKKPNKNERVTEYFERLRKQYGKFAMKKAVDRMWKEENENCTK